MAGHGCRRCGKPVNDNHALCRVCRSSHQGWNDDDPSPPGLTQNVSSVSVNLAPTAEPSHQATVTP